MQRADDLRRLCHCPQMHEVSLIQAALEEAERVAQINSCQIVETVHLRVGTLSGVVPEALTFAFEALKQGTRSAQAHLEIEHVQARARCLTCGHEYLLKEPGVPCPLCQTWSSELLSGKEIELTKVTMA